MDAQVVGRVVMGGLDVDWAREAAEEALSVRV
jgi:hypothetical protein